MRWLGHGLAVIGVVALVGLNLVAPAAFVAARNVERVIDPSLVPPDGQAGLDAELPRASCPDDAVPVLVARPAGAPRTGTARTVRALLRGTPAGAGDRSGLREPAAWNLGRERARAALATLP